VKCCLCVVQTVPCVLSVYRSVEWSAVLVVSYVVFACELSCIALSCCSYEARLCRYTNKIQTQSESHFAVSDTLLTTTRRTARNYLKRLYSILSARAE